MYIASHPRAAFNLETGSGCTPVITLVVLAFHSHRISSWIRIFRRKWGPLSTNSNAALRPDSKRKSLRLVRWGDALGIRPHESSHSFAYPIHTSHVPTITGGIFAIRLLADKRTVGLLAVLGLLTKLPASAACYTPAVTCSVNAQGDHDRPKPAAV